MSAAPGKGVGAGHVVGAFNLDSPFFLTQNGNEILVNIA
jgi:hypothetical protein